MLKNNARVTSKKKDNKWWEIAEKVSACGVERREGVEVRDKLKNELGRRPSTTRHVKDGWRKTCAAHPIRGPHPTGNWS